jgi:hypothetical protein
MGGFYGNITLRGPSQEKVVQALHGRSAIVAPNVGDYTVVFDSVCDEQDIDEIQALTSRLSREMCCSALAVIVHDDDVLLYFLYRDGELADWYNSSPSYFDFGPAKEPAGPAGGDAERLCMIFGADNQQEVENVLRKREYVFEKERHEDLVRALALPRLAVGEALASFDRGEYPEGLSAGQMMRADAPPPLEDRQRRLDREFYNRLGPEDVSHPCRRDGSSRGAIPNSVLCKRHHFEMIKHRDCPFGH